MFDAAICSYHGCYACFWLAGMGGIKSRLGEGLSPFSPSRLRPSYYLSLYFMEVLSKFVGAAKYDFARCPAGRGLDVNTIRGSVVVDCAVKTNPTASCGIRTGGIDSFD